MIAVAALLVGISALGASDPPPEKSTPQKPKTPEAKSEPQKPKTPDEQFQALKKDLNKSQQALGKEFRNAKTDEEQQKIRTRYQEAVEKCQKEVFELAQKNAKEPFAVDALIWVVQNAPGEAATEALTILAKEHIQDKRMGTVAAKLADSGSPQAEKLLRAILEKNPDHKAQAQACFALANFLKQKSEEAPSADTKEAEKYFDLLVTKYADIGSLVEAAKGALFEIRNLALGKTAPEIDGADTDGKKFKLTDYRGKVVLIDFWGNW